MMYNYCSNHSHRIRTGSGEVFGHVEKKVELVPDVIGTPDDVMVLSGAASRVGSAGPAT